jgi:hypothetical protein
MLVIEGPLQRLEDAVVDALIPRLLEMVEVGL